MENNENNNDNNENTSVNEDNQDLPPQYDAVGDARNKIIFLVIFILLMIVGKFLIGGQ